MARASMPGSKMRSETRRSGADEDEEDEEEDEEDDDEEDEEDEEAAPPISPCRGTKDAGKESRSTSTSLSTSALGAPFAVCARNMSRMSAPAGAGAGAPESAVHSQPTIWREWPSC
jgi:hypothetical protein